jgi:hypothetical protein
VLLLLLLLLPPPSPLLLFLKTNLVNNFKDTFMGKCLKSNAAIKMTLILCKQVHHF